MRSCPARLGLLLLLTAACSDDPTHTLHSEEGLGSGDPDALQDPTDWPGPAVEFADLAVFLEFNSTDDDLGVQIFLDAEGWDRMRARGPGGEKVLDFGAHRALGSLGLTELRFESAEPSPAAVLGAIPPGEYAFVGRTVTGRRLIGAAELSHDLPAPPVFTPADGDVVPAAGLTLEWTSVPGAEGYEVIVTDEDTDLEVFARLDGDATTFAVPPEILAPDHEYKAEILAISESGNKTITENVFRTQP